MLINWFTVVAEVVNFLVLVFLLNRFLFPPILSAMDKREQQIKDRFQKASDESAQAKEAESKYADLINEIKAKREDLEKEYRQEADKIRRDLIQQARGEVNDLKVKWLLGLKTQEDQLLLELRGRIAAEVMETVRRVLGDFADTDLEGRIINRFVDRLKEIDSYEIANLKKIPPEKREDIVVKTGFPLDDQSEKAVDQAFSKLLGIVKIRYEFSPELIGGIEASIGGTRISWAIEDFVGNLKENVLKAVKENA